MTSQWAPCLKSPSSRLLGQPFAQPHINEDIKTARHWPLGRNPQVTGGFPSQRIRNASCFFQNIYFDWHISTSTKSQSILIDFQIPCYHFNYRLLVSHKHKHHLPSCGYIACTPCKLTPVNASETNYVLSGILVYDKHSFNCFNIVRILSVQYIWNYFVGNVLWCIFMYVIFIFSFSVVALFYPISTK